MGLPVDNVNRILLGGNNAECGVVQDADFGFGLYCSFIGFAYEQFRGSRYASIFFAVSYRWKRS